MPTVTFVATPALKTWVHRLGGYDGVQMVDPVILCDGDAIEMDDFEAGWAAGSYPDNFVTLEI